MKVKRNWTAQYDSNRNICGYLEIKHGRAILHIEDCPSVPQEQIELAQRYRFNEIILHRVEGEHDCVYAATPREWASHGIVYAGEVILPVENMRCVKRTKRKVTDFDKVAQRLAIGPVPRQS